MRKQEINIKKALLGLAAAGLFVLSNLVDSKRAEDDIREIVREEIENERKVKH